MQHIAMPAPLSGSASGVRQHGDLDVEQRRADRGAEQVLVALVVGVRDERDAGGQQLGAGGLDVDGRRRHRGTRPGGTRPGSRGPRARPARPPSGTSRPTARAPRPGTPRRARGCAGTPAGRRRGTPRRPSGRSRDQSTDRPSRRHSASNSRSSSTVRRSHSSTKFLRLTGTCGPDLPSPPSNGGVNVGVVRQRRVAAHAVVVLHAALGGQAVVVPAHRVEDLAAAHALEPGDDVGVRVGEHVADVQRAGHRRRRRVDRVDLLAGGRAVERVQVLRGPRLVPAGLDTVERDPVRYLPRARGGQGCVGRVRGLGAHGSTSSQIGGGRGSVDDQANTR